MIRVLLVDDEPYVIEGLKTMIGWGKQEFMICGEATNGEDALRMLPALHPDLVITDIKMPVMDGLEFIKQARKSGASKTKFVVLSGYGDFSYLQHAMRYEVSDYVLKPIDEEEFRTLLDKIGKQIRREEQRDEETDHCLAVDIDDLIKHLFKEGPDELLVKKVKSLGVIEDREFKCILIEIDSFTKWLKEQEDQGE